jgi:N-acetylmuramic acid 6-phosphate etherase
VNHPELDHLETEGRLPQAAEFDRLSMRDQLALMAEQDRVAVAAVEAARESMAAAIGATVARMRRGGRLIEVGAGTPGRLAVLDAAECGPTFGVDDAQVVAMMGVDAHDVVVAVSASGRTPYVLGALAAARSAGALSVGVVNNAGSPIAAACDIAVEVLTGPEVISGSTRLKAGTAAKLVLNTISTIVMVRLGHTYGDLMVDVRASNEKLRRRAVRIVSTATGAADDVAATTLAAADGDAKTATVMLLAGVDAEAARHRLDAAGGHVRGASIGQRVVDLEQAE